MRMVVALDAGAMLAKVTRPIGPDETSDVVERDLAELGVPLLLDVVDAARRRDRSRGTAGRCASTYAAAADQRGRADRLDAARARSSTTACAGCIPWPHAYTYLDGARLIVLKSRVGSDPGSDPGQTPAPWSESRATASCVAAGQGTRLELLRAAA